MKQLNKKEINRIKIQMGISDRKPIEERGRFPRSAVFVDRRARERKYAARAKIAY